MVNSKRIVTYSYYYGNIYVYKFTYEKNDEDCTVYPGRISTWWNDARKWGTAELYPGIFQVGSDSTRGKLPVYDTEYGNWRRISAEFIAKFGFAHWIY